jgi:hypothetical protein
MVCLLLLFRDSLVPMNNSGITNRPGVLVKRWADAAKCGVNCHGRGMAWTLGSRHQIRLAGRMVWELGHRRVEGFPGLRASSKYIGFRMKPRGIVECTDAQPDDIGPRRHLDIERRSAVTTKRPGDFVVAVRLRGSCFGVPLVMWNRVAGTRIAPHRQPPALEVVM